MTDDFDVPVLVHIPRHRFKTLNREATKQGTEVSTLLRALVIKVIPEAPTTTPARVTREERDAIIRRRNSEGATDGEIARELGQTRGAIGARRARMGIPAARAVGGQPLAMGDDS
ncbi:MAG: hypothetical protein K0Q46_2514 [Rhodococcus erythropolis]|jgi:hypothetical protein|nr:hypothetical protein [Rhodococcus erythropolis]MDF2895728.1 hypothetical protein [Rhodococcus erythropolis]